MSGRSAAFAFALAVALGAAPVACAPRTPPPPVLRQARAAAPRFSPLGAEASPIDFARMAKFPEPGWQVPRSIQFSPDGAMVTWLASEALDDVMSMFALDRATNRISVLLRAGDLPGGARPRSREEELRRERQRQRLEGITSYRWARRAPVMVIPHAGDVFVRDARGAVRRLTDTPEPEIDPQACPTGERVAFVRAGELWVVDVATKHETQLTRGASAGVTHGLSDFNAQEEFGQPSGFWWSPRCDRIAYVEVDETHVETTPVLGWRGGKPDLMLQKYPPTGGTNPTVRLGVVELATQRTTWARWPDASERYLVDPRWSDKDGALYLQALSRDQKRSVFVRIDPTSGATKELFAETSPGWVTPARTRLLEKSDAVVTTSDATGHRHLDVRALTGGAEPRALTKGDWDVTDLVAVDEDGGRVLFVATKESPLERHLYSVPLEGGPITKLTAERGVHGIASDEKGRAWIDVSSAHDRPPRVHLGATEIPVPRDPDFDRLRIRPPELVTIRGAGGDVLYGALLRPRDLVAGQKHPAVMMVYGGPGAQTVMDSWGPRLLWQHLADRGFFVLQVDNRGTPGRGIMFSRAIHRRFGELELADQLAAASWLASLPEVDPARIGISGHSFGGFMAALAMLKAPGRFAAGVAASPVTDWTTYDTAYTERYMETPRANPDGYAASDLSRFAGALAGPLLLVHANMDENVHYANTAKLVDALVAAHKRFDLLVFPGERHGYRSPAAKAYVAERTVAFFVDHL